MVDKTVYFMRAESGLVKIGVSTNVPVRQKAISGSIGGPVLGRCFSCGHPATGTAWLVTGVVQVE